MKDLLLKGTLTLAILAAANVISLAVVHDEEGCVANAATLAQLKAARQATAGFHSIANAEASGYSDIKLPVPNMGEHWVNFNLVDGIFEAGNPEALVYADLGNGKLTLVAVEYLAPYDPAGPPSGYEGTCDKWSPFPAAPADPIFWTLHAWIWEPNLAGTFAKFNPMVP
jgi:hypothetical protein